METIGLDLLPHPLEGELVSAQFGFDGSILLLETAKIPPRIDGMFVPRTTSGLTWRVHLYRYGQWQSVTLYHPNLNFHHVQKIDDGRILLVASRTKAYAVHNACVYSMQGELLSSFSLDDAIESVSVTQGGAVWVSYFDEGAFGNGPLASFGLIKSDLNGNLLWTAEEFAIYDCYAVNVQHNGGCWFYYYDRFELVQVTDRGTKTYQPNINGSGCFALLGNYIVMQSGYDDRQRFILFEVRGERLIKHGSLTFSDDKGKNLADARYEMRDNNVLAIKDNKLYYRIVNYNDLSGLF